jgi:hypothetical protein
MAGLGFQLKPDTQAPYKCTVHAGERGTGVSDTGSQQGTYQSVLSMQSGECRVRQVQWDA